MKRRDFITLGASAAAWRLAAWAQQGERVRRIGILRGLTEGDTDAWRRVPAFEQALQARGWSKGRNLQIDYRWGASHVDRARPLATELVQLLPDVIVAH